MKAALRLRVVPNAKRSEVVGEYGTAIKVKVQAPSTDGKANEELLRLRAETLNVPSRALTITGGEKARDKAITVEGLSESEAVQRLLGSIGQNA